jgi:hypothetical protein
MDDVSTATTAAAIPSTVAEHPRVRARVAVAGLEGHLVDDAAHALVAEDDEDRHHAARRGPRRARGPLVVTLRGHGGEVLARYRALQAAGAVDPAAERQYLDITKSAFGANVGQTRTRASEMTADTNRESAGAAETQVRAQQQNLKVPTNTATGLAGSSDPG